MRAKVNYDNNRSESVCWCWSSTFYFYSMRSWKFGKCTQLNATHQERVSSACRRNNRLTWNGDVEERKETQWYVKQSALTYWSVVVDVVVIELDWRQIDDSLMSTFIHSWCFHLNLLFTIRGPLDFSCEVEDYIYIWVGICIWQSR